MILTSILNVVRSNKAQMSLLKILLFSIIVLAVLFWMAFYFNGQSETVVGNTFRGLFG